MLLPGEDVLRALGVGDWLKHTRAEEQKEHETDEEEKKKKKKSDEEEKEAEKSGFRACKSSVEATAILASISGLRAPSKSTVDINRPVSRPQIKLLSPAPKSNC
eukprot:3312072-Rhodomonas_salina.4